MKLLDPAEIAAYVAEHIGAFHDARLRSMEEVELKTILRRKNPYLFKAKHILTASDVVKGFLDAHLSSQEETIFGGFLEQLAIFVCERVFNGFKSGSEGIDLEVTRHSVRYIIAIKSGPHWGNSQQLLRMRDNFSRARRTLATSGGTTNVVAINGCCYGKDDRPEKEGYRKLCGQRFWEFVSGDPDFYLKIIEPLGHQARQRNDAFAEGYARVINQFTQTFTENFCDGHGAIDWDRLVRFNSGMSPAHQPTPTA